MRFQEFLTKAQLKHGEKYTYTQPDSELVDTGRDMQIFCIAHQEYFTQKGTQHLWGYGCWKCGVATRSAAIRDSWHSFVAKARKRHGERYTYPLQEYAGSQTKVRILCGKHQAEFLQTPANHISGQGCPECGRESRKKGKQLPFQKFAERANRLHPDKYTYDPDTYVDGQTPTTIGCKRCQQSFQQIPSQHLLGYGCWECGVGDRSVSRRSTWEDFLTKAHEVHGDLYAYPPQEYSNNLTKVRIVCRKHQTEFQQTPGNHLSGQGCPECPRPYSRPHQEVEEYLREIGVEYITNTRAIIAPKELDTYLPEHHLAIEVNGTYWHSLDAERQEEKGKHREKFQACLAAGIQLLQIDEHEWQQPRVQAIWKSRLASLTQKHSRRLWARETSFQSCSKEEAKSFLEEHHLQGDTPYKTWCFGLYGAEGMVGVATFSLHEHSLLNLTRLAFKKNLTVVGGAQKLFKNAVQHLPQRSIVTFSDNRYSQGKVYAVLGFKKDKDLPPSYQWFFRNTLLNKRMCRHQHLPKLIGDLYDPALTEHQNMFRAGARCLYDAGYQRWMYPQTANS